jgi:hypothetical protein
VNPLRGPYRRLEMTRTSLLTLTLAATALLVGAPAATAAVDPKTLPATTEFMLPASNGLRAHLDVFNEEFTLEIRRRSGYAVYRVEGEATEAGLKARFGTLGVIDLTFQPTETELEKPPKGCVGPPSRFGTGVFVGTVSFTGEGEFVRIAETEVEGRLAVWREHEWRCPRHERRVRPRRAPRPTTKAEDPATLAANQRRCDCGLVAYSFPEEPGRASSFFVGFQSEEREGMEIGRVTATRAGASAFTYNHRAGTASIHPPAPFTGSGFFKRRPHSRDLWRSSIRVPLLGAAAIDMRDGGFRAALVNELPEFR